MIVYLGCREVCIEDSGTLNQRLCYSLRDQLSILLYFIRTHHVYTYRVWVRAWVLKVMVL